MRKITLIVLFVFSVVLVSAQQMLYYNLENTLNEVNGNGPELTVLGNFGQFVVEELSEINHNTKTVYRFEKNSGLQFNNTAASNFMGEEYSIELYFVFDELTSWKRVIDWKNRQSDNGAYIYYGQLNFYNIVTSGEAPVEQGEYTYYVVTRKAASKEVLIYTDAMVMVTFTDDLNDAVISDDGVLNFFHDDLVVMDEASPGAVAMIKLYNYALSQEEITANWEDIGGQVFGIKEPKVRVPVLVYPNPAVYGFVADLSGFDQAKPVELMLYNEAGRLVYVTRETAGAGRTEIGTAGLSPGLYLLKTVQGNKEAVSRIVIR